MIKVFGKGIEVIIRQNFCWKKLITNSNTSEEFNQLNKNKKW